MWIFGKKANQASNSSPLGAPEVPAELQALYGHKTVGQRIRRLVPYILPAVSLLIVVAAIVLGAMWLRSSHSNKPSVATNQNHSSSSSSSSSQGTTNVPVPTITPPPATAPTPAPSAIPSDTTPSDTTPAAAAPNAAGLTNTGPGDIFLIVAATTVSAAAASYARQLRNARK